MIFITQNDFIMHVTAKKCVKIGQKGVNISKNNCEVWPKYATLTEKK